MGSRSRSRSLSHSRVEPAPITRPVTTCAHGIDIMDTAHAQHLIASERCRITHPYATDKAEG